MKRPLFCLALFFCSGIFIARLIRISLPLYLLAIISLVFSFLSIRKGLSFDVLMCCLVFCLGASLLKNYEVLPRCHILKFVSHRDNVLYTLKGFVNSEPLLKYNKISFIFRTEEIKFDNLKYSCCGDILVYIRGNQDLHYAEELVISGKLYRPFSFSKEFNYRDYLKRQGIYCILSTKKNSIIKHLGKNAGNPLISLAHMARSNMKAAFDKNLSTFSANIFNALILGERQNLPFWVNDGLLKSGTIHIIAISGFNIGIVAFIILLLLKIIRIPRKLRYMFTILFLLVYCILTGANPPVVRATIMAIVLLLSYFLKREVDIYNSVSIATFIILAINPWQLFEISFQLSFLSIIFIVWLTPKITAIFLAEPCKINWIRLVILTFSVSLAAWLGLLPLIAYYFKIITPITLVANMIIVPYTSMIVAAGFALVFISMFIPPLAFMLAASCELSISMLFKINSLLIAIPGAYFKLPKISFVYVLLYYTLLISVFNLSKIPILNHIIGRNYR